MSSQPTEEKVSVDLHETATEATRIEDGWYRAVPRADEAERLAELESYGVMDSGNDDKFDSLVQLARAATGMPIALVSLIDDRRQWFKAKIGIEARETPRDMAFCSHALHNDIMIVEDARKDERFRRNPLVVGPPDVIFYAGAALHTKAGKPLGTLCVIDNKPNKLDERQQNALKTLAQMTMAQLELSKSNKLLGTKVKELQIKEIELREAKRKAEDASKAKGRFLANMSHEMRTPLHCMLGYAQMMDQDVRDNPQVFPAEFKEHLYNITFGGNRMLSLINNVLDLMKIQEGKTEFTAENVVIAQQLRRLVKLHSVRAVEMNVGLKCSCDKDTPSRIVTDRVKLEQIVSNLLSNAIKFTPAKGKVSVKISFSPLDSYSQQFQFGIVHSISAQKRVMATLSNTESKASVRCKSPDDDPPTNKLLERVSSPAGESVRVPSSESGSGVEEPDSPAPIVRAPSMSDFDVERELVGNAVAMPLPITQQVESLQSTIASAAPGSPTNVAQRLLRGAGSGRKQSPTPKNRVRRHSSRAFTSRVGTGVAATSNSEPKAKIRPGRSLAAAGAAMDRILDSNEASNEKTVIPLRPPPRVASEQSFVRPKNLTMKMRDAGSCDSREDSLATSDGVEEDVHAWETPGTSPSTPQPRWFAGVHGAEAGVISRSPSAIEALRARSVDDLAVGLVSLVTLAASSKPVSLGTSPISSAISSPVAVGVQPVKTKPPRSTMSDVALPATSTGEEDSLTVDVGTEVPAPAIKTRSLGHTRWVPATSNRDPIMASPVTTPPVVREAELASDDSSSAAKAESKPLTSSRRRRHRKKNRKMQGLRGSSDSSDSSNNFFNQMRLDSAKSLSDDVDCVVFSRRDHKKLQQPQDSGASDSAVSQGSDVETKGSILRSKALRSARSQGADNASVSMPSIAASTHERDKETASPVGSSRLGGRGLYNRKSKPWQSGIGHGTHELVLRAQPGVSSELLARARAVSCQNRDGWLHIEIEDTGMGIAPEKMQTLFREYQQSDGTISRKHGGTGLGLSISYLLASLMGGDITAESTVGKGSSFVVHLPVKVVSQAESVRADGSPAREADGMSSRNHESLQPIRALPGRCVVFADDDGFSRQMLMRFSKRLGVVDNCHMTADGVEAVEAYHRLQPALMLVDLHMPKLDGTGVVQHIREHEARLLEEKGITQYTPVYALTGDVFLHQQEEAAAAGFTGYVCKPASLRLLHSIIQKALAEESTVWPPSVDVGSNSATLLQI